MSTIPLTGNTVGIIAQVQAGLSQNVRRTVFHIQREQAQGCVEGQRGTVNLHAQAGKGTGIVIQVIRRTDVTIVVDEHGTGRQIQTQRNIHHGRGLQVNQRTAAHVNDTADRSHQILQRGTADELAQRRQVNRDRITLVEQIDLIGNVQHHGV